MNSDSKHSLVPKPQAGANLTHNIACNTLPYVFAWMGLPAQRGVVRHGEIKPEQPDNGANQTFGLPQRQAKHRAHRQSRY